MRKDYDFLQDCIHRQDEIRHQELNLVFGAGWGGDSQQSDYSSLISFLQQPSTRVLLGQKMTPSPSRLSSQKLPQKTVPFFHLYLPLPCLSPACQLPSQTSPLVNIIFPYPCFLPNLKSPEQQSPVLQVQLPYPVHMPQLTLPQYSSPFAKHIVTLTAWLSLKTPLRTYPVWYVIVPYPLAEPLMNSPQKVRRVFLYMPCPCGLPSANWPLQVDQSFNFRYPFPCLTPLFHYPSQKYAPSSAPQPLIWSFSHFPLKTLPSAQQKVPSPFFFPFLICPSYLSPLLDMSMPSPQATSFSHSPRQISKLADQNIPVPCLRLSLTSPQQVSPLGYSMACTFLRCFPSEPQMYPFRKEQMMLSFSYYRRVEQTERCWAGPDITDDGLIVQSNINDQSRDPPLQSLQESSSESQGLASRQSEQRRQPQSMGEQLINFRQTTQPMMRRMDGAGDKASWGSSFVPSPQTGALQSISIKAQSLAQQLGHQMVPRAMTPLLQVIFIFLLQVLHFSRKLALMGESVTCMILLGATSSMLSAGRPSETVKVVNRSCGGQWMTDCPSGVVTLMQSRVFLTKATLLISVQN